MKDVSGKILNLLEQYNGDITALLRDHPELDYLYALSDMRESVLEWFPFEPEASLLQVGADYGALTGLFARKVREVVVADSKSEEFKVCKVRYPGAENIDYIQSGFVEYARSQSIEDGRRFDYVVLAGTLRKPYAENLAAAKSLLKLGGKLILTVCNELGVKYWTGAPKESDCFTRSGIAGLLAGDKKEGEMGESISWYYPMPDYKLATSIYSETYLPQKGDLTHAVIAYDYPRYLFMNVGASFDAICENERFEEFANSFLLIWSSNERN